MDASEGRLAIGVHPAFRVYLQVLSSLTFPPPKDSAVGDTRTDSSDQQAASGREGLDPTLAMEEQETRSADRTGHSSGEK